MIKSLKNNRGLVPGEILILGLVFIVLIILGVFLINREKAISRDAERLATITQIEAAFETLFSDTNSYDKAAQEGCFQVGQRVSQCNLADYDPFIVLVKDPGGFDFIVSQVPDQSNYQVTFTLERAHGNLEKGEHTLGPGGIQ